MVDHRQEIAEEGFTGDIPSGPAGIEKTILMARLITAIAAIVGCSLEEIAIFKTVGCLTPEIGQIGREVVIEERTFLIEQQFGVDGMITQATVVAGCQLYVPIAGPGGGLVMVVLGHRCAVIVVVGIARGLDDQRLHRRLQASVHIGLRLHRYVAGPFDP